MATIVGGPQFVVGTALSRPLSTLALRLVEASKIHCNDSSLRSSYIRVIADHGSVYDELLGDRVRLNDDILNFHGLIRNLNFIPSLALIKGIQNFLGRCKMLSHHNQTTVITKLVNIRAVVHFLPV